MASERQIAANRANANKSTGPKSRAGRARTSGNSRQHGLAARTTLDQERFEAVQQLAQEIVDSLLGQIDLAQAIAIAEAELDLSRARGVSNALLASLPGDEGAVDSCAIPTTSANDFALAVLRFKRVERYVRRLQLNRDRLVRSWILEQRIGPAKRTQFFSIKSTKTVN